MNALKIYSYETKCRRCGTFVNWFFSEAVPDKYKDFLKSMIDHIQSPIQYKCKPCNKETIQDVVSYSEREGEDLR